MTSTGPGTRSVEEQAIVSQRASALRRELIHLDHHLLPDNFARNN